MKKIFKWLRSLFKNIKIMINPISQSNQIEFNDSVLTTKAWNSSRYDGKQLQGSTINEFTNGDTTYGKTPVVSNYTRNIYIGNSILNLSGSTDTGAVDNNLLSPFPDFSYVTINDYITINDDNSITKNTIDVRANNIPSKTGFYRAFYEDFPISSFCNVFTTNTKVKTSLENQYKIYFNGGQLRKLIEITPPGTGIASGITYNTSSNVPTIEAPGGTITATSIIYDDGYVRKTGYAKDLSIFQAPFNAQSNDNYHELFNSFFTFKDDSSYKGDKRLFLTFCTTSSLGATPIRTLSTGSIPISSTIPLATENLSELSTIELGSISGEPTVSEPDIVFSSSFNTTLNQNYSTVAGGQTPQIARNVLFSRVEDANPSLLLNINKEEVFPDGLSDTNFIIIPENLHPFVKDNLIYFLTRAGIDVGGNTSPLVELNNNNFNLP
jgi:hypothetical protein